jgi:thiamine monophosphate synthase
MKTVELPNGRTAVSFVPEDSKDLAIVHIATIKRLAALLQTAHPMAIIQEFIKELTAICSKHDVDFPLRDAVEIAEDFVNFHKTINLIQEYKPEPVYGGNLDD